MYSISFFNGLFNLFSDGGFVCSYSDVLSCLRDPRALNAQISDSLTFEKIRSFGYSWCRSGKSFVSLWGDN